MRAAIYCRLGKEDGEAGVASMQPQKCAARERAADQGLEIIGANGDNENRGAEVVERSGLRRMLAAARRRECDVVVVHDLGRLVVCADAIVPQVGR